jgi:hypothetical protein
MRSVAKEVRADYWEPVQVDTDLCSNGLTAGHERQTRMEETILRSADQERSLRLRRHR